MYKLGIGQEPICSPSLTYPATMKQPSLPALGIDVSKDNLEAVLLLADRPRRKTVRNAPAGFRALSGWLSKNGAEHVHACLEATGPYAEAAALFLCEAGHLVSLVNPRRIKGYAESRLQRSKTDRADAQLIARFCQRERPEPWQPPAPEERQLRELVRHRDALVRERDQNRNRLDTADHEAVRHSIEAVLEALEAQISEIGSRIEAHLKAHPALRRQRDLLITIPGVGKLTAAVLLAEVGDFSRFGSARQLAAYAGLIPSHRQSGTSVRGRARLSKVGNARLRRALFMPAMVALRWNGAIKAFGERLSQRGKKRKQVVAAAMRKLLHIAYGVLKSGRPFDETLHPSPC